MAVGHNSMPLIFYEFISFISYTWHVPIKVMKEGLAPTALPTQVLTVPKGKEYYIQLTYVHYVYCLCVS